MVNNIGIQFQTGESNVSYIWQQDIPEHLSGRSVFHLYSTAILATDSRMMIEQKVAH